jgi:hypothetical protein
VIQLTARVTSVLFFVFFTFLKVIGGKIPFVFYMDVVRRVKVDGMLFAPTCSVYRTTEEN